MTKVIVDTLGPLLDKSEYVFPYWGPLLIRTKIKPEHLNFLRESTLAAKERKRLANDSLAGHLEDEFHIPKNYIEEFILIDTFNVTQILGHQLSMKNL